jgi:hypothetical protein
VVGPFAHKAVVFDNLKPLLAPGGVIFGSTILGFQAKHNAPGHSGPSALPKFVPDCA